MSSLIDKTLLISTLLERQNMLKRYDDITSKHMHILYRFLPTNNDDTITSILDYLSGYGEKKNVFWMIQGIAAYEDKYSKMIPNTLPHNKYFSNSMSELDRALLSQENLNNLIHNAYTQVQDAKKYGFNSFAWGMLINGIEKRNMGIIDLAFRLNEKIYGRLMSLDTEKYEIGGDNSHSDFAQFMAGYGIKAKDIPNRIEEMLDLWNDLNMPEMSDAFNKGFILSILNSKKN